MGHDVGLIKIFECKDALKLFKENDYFQKSKIYGGTILIKSCECIIKINQFSKTSPLLSNKSAWRIRGYNMMILTKRRPYSTN